MRQRCNIQYMSRKHSYRNLDTWEWYLKDTVRNLRQNVVHIFHIFNPWYCGGWRSGLQICDIIRMWWNWKSKACFRIPSTCIGLYFVDFALKIYSSLNMASPFFNLVQQYLTAVHRLKVPIYPHMIHVGQTRQFQRHRLIVLCIWGWPDLMMSRERRI